IYLSCCATTRSACRSCEQKREHPNRKPERDEVDARLHADRGEHERDKREQQKHEPQRNHHRNPPPEAARESPSPTSYPERRLAFSARPPLNPRYAFARESSYTR